jgi:hypothetical protein
MQPFFIMKKLGRGCFGSFGTHYSYFHYFLWEKVVLTYDQLELKTSPRERIEFVSQGPTVLCFVISLGRSVHTTPAHLTQHAVVTDAVTCTVAPGSECFCF